MYGDIIEELREGLAVSADHDASIMRGIRKAARQLLKIYNFPKSVIHAQLPILAATNSVVLPTDAGKVKAVVLTTVEGGTTLYKTLRRRAEAGLLPTYDGPNQWDQVGLNLVLDTPMPAILATPYYVEVWYQTMSDVVAEAWLSVDYADAIEHLAGMELALKRRKKEAAEIYGQLWGQDTKILATFTSELEFNLMDMGMGEPIGDTPSLERYPGG